MVLKRPHRLLISWVYLSLFLISYINDLKVYTYRSAYSYSLNCIVSAFVVQNIYAPLCVLLLEAITNQTLQPICDPSCPRHHPIAVLSSLVDDLEEPHRHRVFLCL